MKVELLRSIEVLARELEAADNATLVAQQIGYISAIHLLETLLNKGVTEERVRRMLGQMRSLQEMAHAIAAKRGPNLALEIEE